MSPEAEIDSAAMRYNLDRVRDCCPTSRIWAVIKADGYGHGILRVAAMLRDADGHAVARIEEGMALREAGFPGPVLILEGPLDAGELDVASDAGFDIALHQEQQMRLLLGKSRLRPMRVWIKVDTGMHRLGFAPSRVSGVFERLRQCPAVAGLPKVMTHLANADDRDDPYTSQQLRRFRHLLQHLPATELSVANSAGLLGWSDSRLDWVRPGIMLYGVSPFLNETGKSQGLKPVMTLTAPLIAVNRYQAGEPVGYGGSFVCPENMPVGVIGIGYGDGYPRHAPNGTPVLLNGCRVPIVGRVSMDMLCVDLRSQPQAGIGDRATLWGKGLPVEEIAQAAGTIAYELLCGVTGRVGLRETQPIFEQRAGGY
jgi:alanine racemase